MRHRWERTGWAGHSGLVLAILPDPQGPPRQQDRSSQFPPHLLDEEFIPGAVTPVLHGRGPQTPQDSAWTNQKGGGCDRPHPGLSL